MQPGPHRASGRVIYVGDLETPRSTAPCSVREAGMMRALVIDDDVNIGTAIQAILASQNFETALAFRAHSGIHALELSSFDIVVVDIFMPGMDGLDTIERIRQQAPNIPIVAMTGFRFRPSMDFLGLAIQRGATSSVRKPFTPQQLINAINTSLRKSHALNKTPVMNGSPPC
jgi:DNA-binding NtrC family response regulator